MTSRHLSESDRRSIAERYMRGDAVPDIARDLGVTKNAVYYWLSHYEVQLRPVGHASRRYTCDEHYFDVIDSEEKAYYLGLFASDGWIGDKGQVAVGLSGDDDRVLLERLKASLSYTGEIKRKVPTYPNAKPHYTLLCTSRRLAAALTSHGIGPRKSLTLEFNEALRPDLIRHYVRGYVDGDGSISIRKDGSTLVGITSSRIFIEALATYLDQHLRISPHIERYLPPRDPASGSLKLGGNLVCFILLDWLYRDASIYLPRKEIKYRECKRLVEERLRYPERLYNLLGNTTIMEHVRRCADLLGRPLDLSNWNGLSLNPREQQDIIDLYARGYGVHHIRQMRRCSNTLVRNVLTRNGVKIRDVTKQTEAYKRLLISA